MGADSVHRKEIIIHAKETDDATSQNQLETAIGRDIADVRGTNPIGHTILCKRERENGVTRRRDWGRR